MHLSRREAMRLLGTGAASAGLGLTAACRSGGVPEAESEPPPGRAAVVFPEGAIVRTLLADVSLVTEAFRSAVTLGARRLDEVRALVEEARPTATEGWERDRTSTS